jgi:hypothetical protein
VTEAGTGRPEPPGAIPGTVATRTPLDGAAHKMAEAPAPVTLPALPAGAAGRFAIA